MKLGRQQSAVLFFIFRHKRGCRIYSQLRINAGQVFLYEMDSFEAIRTCSGKVTVTDALGKKSVGFILEERRSFWKIQLKNTNHICFLKKLEYNYETETYNFNDFVDHCGRRITSFWPIRLSLSKSGSCRMTINRVSFQKQLPKRIITAPMFTS